MRIKLILGAAIVAMSPLASYATVYNLPPNPPPTTLEPGDTLNVFDGADTVVELDASAGSTINLYGGTMGVLTYVRGNMNIYGGQASAVTMAIGATINLSAGKAFEFSMGDNSLLNVNGGEIASYLAAYDSVVNLTSGTISGISGFENSILNMSGGNIPVGRSHTKPIRNSTFNVSGGVLGDIWFGDDTVLNLSGGQIVTDFSFLAHADSSVHLFVRNVALDGISIPSNAPMSHIQIDVTNLNSELTGTLKDGSPFAFQLRSDLPTNPYQIRGAFIATDPAHTQNGPPREKVEILITLVPEPSSAFLFGISGASLWLIGRARRRTQS